MRAFTVAALAATLAFLPVLGAQAYVGPGAGLSLLGALWGLLIAVLLAVGFVVIWPIRRILKRRRRRPGHIQEVPRVSMAASSVKARSRSRSA